MIRFALNLALLVALAAWIAAQDGSLQLQWGERYIEVGLTSALAAAALALLLWWGVAKCWFWVKYGWARRRERRLRRKQESGLAALTLTFGALAGNDLRAAQKSQRQAVKLLGHQPLVDWLGAELASRRGEDAAAAATYRRLAADPSAALLGWRGLLKQDAAHGQSPNMLALAEEALSNRAIAKQSFVHDVRLRELALRSDWAEAVLALHSAQSAGAYGKSRARALSVVLELMYARSLRAEDPKRSTRLFESAYRAAPDFVPAACAYIDALLLDHDRATANKAIRGAWMVSPHVDILNLFIRTNEDESPIARLQRFEQFALKRKDHVVTQLALGHLCIAADVFGKARTHLQAAQAIRMTRQGYQQLADLAQVEQANSMLAHDYARQAARTANVGQWVCSACNSHHETWGAVCPACGALAEIQWQENEQAALALIG